ncbi:HlyD family secretion protein [Aetokthonos hydrillicola Thurmond2011]|jgi:membrane fusion protein (multidrug efflux system)|uniref:HlyD family secretion protein n=1 Tax=Aetokthonos hydrillicola Thurmond2011 TaxID=2712845 RepID=A0AAP5I892_9CYAN|nr:HlyD family secretion protein [Aetokthonos hydrillicola]MBO3460582.1 HlyD family secretion protein [Aetokthonos hydrillicola CCALA 1050]MBW4585290.1 HlyD family secretion protein [Aetokthonos hydrillicola CCALA 1050]MDR9896575.1 HlyD family secretion protein [Aetokthonos hydrillicola Thurmond2011]
MKRLNSSEQTKQVPDLKKGVIDVAPTDSNNNVAKPRPSSRPLLLKLGLGVVLGAGAIATGIYGYQYNNQHPGRYQKTDNAYVSADIQPLSSSIGGRVTNIAVSENQVVSPSDVLVTLDPRDYLISLTQAKASLELAKLQAALAQKNLDNLVLNAPEPEPIPAKNSQAKQAAQKRRMIQAKNISQQREINQQKYKAALAAIAQKQADVKKAELQLSYTNISTLVAGKVSNKNVQLGQMIQPGQTLMTIVQPDPWIVANFRENQLEKIQPGQNVDIKINAFPSRHFKGKVDSVSPLSVGNQPTGNTSDKQRIPVKILFDKQSIQGYESRIIPGMSAVTVVDTK